MGTTENGHNGHDIVNGQLRPFRTLEVPATRDRGALPPDVLAFTPRVGEESALDALKNHAQRRRGGYSRDAKGNETLRFHDASIHIAPDGDSVLVLDELLPDWQRRIPLTDAALIPPRNRDGSFNTDELSHFRVILLPNVIPSRVQLSHHEIEVSDREKTILTPVKPFQWISRSTQDPLISALEYRWGRRRHGLPVERTFSTSREYTEDQVDQKGQ